MKVVFDGVFKTEYIVPKIHVGTTNLFLANKILLSIKVKISQSFDANIIRFSKRS